MSIFKNGNETAYTGGKKHWADVIKNTGDGNLLIWRQPEEDFNTNSTLVVMPGEEAIFIKGGRIETVSEEGTYNLKTDNYPFISRIRNLFTGGVSSYNCVVYFVRKAHSMQIAWGTPNPMQIRDNALGMLTNVQANGSFRVQVDKSTIFLEKLIGSNVQFETQEGLNDYFFNQSIQYITDSLQDSIENSKEEIIRTFKRKTELAEKIITPKLQPVLENYGLKLVNFSIATLQFVNDELRRNYENRIQQMNLDAREKILSEQAAAQGEQAHFEILGKNWKLQQEAHILRDLANNQGTGGVAASTGAGLGFGMAAGSVFGGMMTHFTSGNDFSSGDIQSELTDITSKKKNENQNGDTTSNKSLAEQIKELQEALEMGFISQAEFDTTRQEIIDKFKNNRI